jgi:adenosylcobinamide-phosphate guanylyltransferase
MCGGEGTRLDAPVEKPLYEIDGVPMIDRVVDALAASQVDTTMAVLSPATPNTREHLRIPAIEAPGDGYVADLQYALEEATLPVLTVAADLPLLSAGIVDEVLEHFESQDRDESLTVCVPASLKHALGASVDSTRQGSDRTLAPTGCNVVADTSDESTMVSWDARLAVNVNRRSDAELAEAIR